MTGAGLRELQKRRTRSALSASALHLVIREGLDALTANRVAAVAGVSRRTVFNYFPRLEDVLIAGIEEATAELVDEFLARPPEEPIRESVQHILLHLGSEFIRQGQMLERAARRSPRTRRITQDFTESQTDAIERAMLRRIGPDADPLYAAGLAASVTAVLARVIRMTTTDDEDDDTDSDDGVLHDRMRLAMNHLFAGYDESGARAATPKG
jgi:AcrR family transcriptional regulator